MDSMLGHLAESVSNAGTLEELTRPLLEILEEITGLESTYLTTIDLDQGLQHILYARNSGQMQIPEGLAVPWEDTLCKRSLDEGRSYTEDVDGCWGDSDAARALGISTYVSTPVRTVGGELYGTLCGASSRRKPLAPNAEKVMAMFSRLIGQHVERERLLIQLSKANADLAVSALVDAVTGLPNRRSLLQELPRMLARARRDGAALVVAFIDLDDFKAINDSYGHQAGDQFLSAMGGRILGGRRGGDFVARIGGDEFVVLSPVARDGAQRSAEIVCAGIARDTRGEFQLEGHCLAYSGASVGVAFGGGDADPDSLLRQADAAMYAAKQSRAARET